MKELNNNGWGLVSFLVFILIFVICLILSALGLKYIGLLDDDWHFVDFSILTKSKEEIDTSYNILEEKMTSSAKRYINDYYSNNLGLDTLNIKVSSLVNNGYLSDFTDIYNKECTGYVSVYLENNTIIYKPYLKCNNYETIGYEKRKDN